MNTIHSFTSLSVGLLVLMFLSCSPQDKKETQQEQQAEKTAPAQNDLPAMTLVFPDGSKQSAKDLPGKSVLVLFQPDCDHCQREAEQIRQHLSGFKDYKLYFISSAPIPDIIKFAEDYQLKDKPNVTFAQTTVNDVINTYGPIESPSLYLYDAHKKLIQSFNGEVAIEVVLKYI